MKEANPKVHIIFDSVYITSLQWQNYRVEEQISGCQELGTGGETVLPVAIKG